MWSSECNIGVIDICDKSSVVLASDGTGECSNLLVEKKRCGESNVEDYYR